MRENIEKGFHGRSFTTFVLLFAALVIAISDRQAVEQAVSLDPMTAAACTLDQIHEMLEELFRADAPYLPQFG
jgi:alpha-galactosidase/6-phospho-beta-glucosidase family protein